jgi:hypothetical protein
MEHDELGPHGIDRRRELVGRRGGAKHGPNTRAPRLGRPRGGRVRGEQHHGLDARHSTDEVQRARRLGRLERQHHDGAGVLVEAARELARRAHDHLEARSAAQQRFHAGRGERALRRDQRSDRRRRPACGGRRPPPLGHAHACAARTNRMT